MYSSRQKKVPTMYSLFKVVDKKMAGFKRSFISVDVVSAYLLVAVVSTFFFATACLKF